MISRIATSKKIYLLIAAVLASVGAVFVVMHFRPPLVAKRVAPVVAPPVDQVKLHADWLAAVHRTTDGLRADSPLAEFTAARTTLLELRVTAADRDAHAALIMALLSLERGDPGAFDALTDARRNIGL